MRTLFFALLLANAIAFAWGALGSFRVSGEPQLLDQQLRPEAIRLLPPDQVRRTSAGAANAGAKKTLACVELGAFSPSEQQKVAQALAPFDFGTRLAQHRVQEVAAYWVYMPPQPSRQGANQKITELKHLGVDEYFMVQDDPEFRYAISLGVFKTEDAAKTRLTELQAKGVRSARVGRRGTQVQKVYFTIRAVPEDVLAKLQALRQGFAGADLKPCSAQPAPPPAGRAGVTSGLSRAAPIRV